MGYVDDLKLLCPSGKRLQECLIYVNNFLVEMASYSMLLKLCTSKFIMVGTVVRYGVELCCHNMIICFYF